MVSTNMRSQYGRTQTQREEC